MPFENSVTTIHLIDLEEGEAEVLIENIPVPHSYNTDRNYPDLLDDEKKRKANTTAKWILKDAARVIDEYDYETSDSKSNKPNHYLKDVYFECSVDDLDEAVLASKKFLTRLEEKIVHHCEEFDKDYPAPSDEF